MSTNRQSSTVSGVIDVGYNIRGGQNVAFNFRDKVSIDTPVGERLEKVYIGTLPIKEL